MVISMMLLISMKMVIVLLNNVVYKCPSNKSCTQSLWRIRNEKTSSYYSIGDCTPHLWGSGHSTQYGRHGVCQRWRRLTEVAVHMVADTCHSQKSCTEAYWTV